MLKFAVAVAVAASTFGCTLQVGATFSLVATDSQTRMVRHRQPYPAPPLLSLLIVTQQPFLSDQVGGVGASCNESCDIFDGLYLAAPGKSVLVTQALLLERGSEIVQKAVEMMRDETPPNDVIATMRKMDTASETLKVGTFPTESLRQYGTTRSLSVTRSTRNRRLD